MNSLDSSFAATLVEIEPQIDADQYFANTIQSGIDTVLAINFNPQSTTTFNELPVSIVDIGPDPAERISVLEMSGYTGNLKVLQDAATGNGSMNQQPDADGIVRWVPFIIRFGSELFPTLPLEMIRVYNFLEGYELLTEAYGELEVVTAVRIGTGPGAFTIPTDGSGQVLAPFVGRSSLGNNEFFPYISATDVLRDTLSEKEKLAMQNALVLIGTSAPGLGDIRAMPLQRIYPGVEVHANILNALLNSITTVDIDSGESSTKPLLQDSSHRGTYIFHSRQTGKPGPLLSQSLCSDSACRLDCPSWGRLPWPPPQLFLEQPSSGRTSSCGVSTRWISRCCRF